MSIDRRLLLKCWIVVCTASVAAGWLLSSVGQLNLPGYLVAMSVTIAPGAVFLLKRAPRYRIRAHRFRRALPLMFAAVVLLALLGGILYAPSNYDALTYRVPRMLQWLAAGRWNWITTANDRLNYSAPNFEWMTTPLLIFTRTDRLLFLQNIIAFLFLPGLIFSTYRMLQVPSRVAWVWMWILPASYCFALQAASIGNDMIGAVLVLASLHFCLRAFQSRSISDISFALLAIALATGVKATNVPLVLVCVVALWPVRRVLLLKAGKTAIVLAISLLVSYAPIALLNHHFTGDWAGDPHNSSQLRTSNPLTAILGNTLQVGTQALQPPLFPGATQVQARVASMMPHKLTETVSRGFPRFHPTMGELPQEEAAGLGLAITLLVLIGLVARFVPDHQGAERVSLECARHSRMIMATVFLAFTIVMIKMGSEATPRLVAPYYLVLLPAALMHPVNTRLARKSWWRIAAAVCIASTALVIFLTPARPLWPAETVLGALQSKWPGSRILARAEQVYSVYRQRNDLLGPLRDSLPVTAKDICLVAGGDDSDLALWRPFGSRKVSHLVGPYWENDSRECNWVVGKTTLIPTRYGLPLDELLLRAQGQLIARKTITSKVTTGPEEWFVAHLWVLSTDSFSSRQLEPALVLTVINNDRRNGQP